MNKRDPEYDRFGPWVIEISDEDPPPPIFLPYLTREETPLLSVKIPRKIERRNANPGMNLYDYLVTLYEEDVVILQRVEADVLSHNFYYRDVKYLRQHESLLKGILHLAMGEKSFDLPFNTVSAGLMLKVRDLIRSRYVDGYARVEMAEDVPLAEDELSFFFTHLLEEQKARNPQIQVLASQVDTAIATHETKAWRRVLLGMIRKTLLESLHLTNGRELKIISREKIYKYQWQTIHGKDICTIPIENITAVNWEADAQNTAVLNLHFETAGGTVSYAMMRDNGTLPSYEHFLAGIGQAEESKTSLQV